MSYVIAVVGAGGKSSYIEEQANFHAARGKRVAVTTTTHIFRAPDREGIICRGKAEGEKYSRLAAEEYEDLCRNSDVVLVEADGARHRPLKIPAEHEPVIPENADKIVVVMGSFALGRSFGEVCYRSELADPALFQEGLRGALREKKVTQPMVDVLARRYYLEPLRRKYPDREIEFLMSQPPGGGGNQTRRVALILMASGSSRRFGEENKLLADWRGKELYRWQLEALLEARQSLRARGILAEVALVSCHQEILGERGDGAARLYNPMHEEGIAASVRIGAEFAFSGAGEAAFPLAGGADAAAFFVADRPCFGAEDVFRMIFEYVRSGKKTACAYSDYCGNPGIFDRSLRGELLSLRGDRGPLGILKRNPREVYYYVVAERKLRDIDRREDLREGG